MNFNIIPGGNTSSQSHQQTLDPELRTQINLRNSAQKIKQLRGGLSSHSNQSNHQTTEATMNAYQTHSAIGGPHIFS
jgi:hypothetical protein